MSDGQGEFVSRAAGIRVREADLGATTLIGSGRATDAHRLDSFTVPGHHGGLVFVRVRDRDAAHWDAAALAQLVALRWGLDARERALLDGLAAWPLAVVEGEGGEVVGCLVPLAAHPFYYLPADDMSGGKVPQQAKWLVSAPKRARRAGAAAVGERDVVARATVLARVCVLFDLLHRHGVVFGDLSERSVLFGVGAVAEAFVVGCEGATLGVHTADEPHLQRNSAGWAAPETFASGQGEPDAQGESDALSGPSDRSGADARGEQGALCDDAMTDAATSRVPSVQTVGTDLFKLGLLVLRVLAPAGDGLERSRDAERIRSVFDETGQRMMRAALGEDAAARPSASEWYDYLRGVIVENLSAPTIARVSVSPALVAEGDEVRLEVELSGARTLTIEMPGRADITREVGGRAVTERFTARQSGRIRVRAANAHGEAVAMTDAVRVLPVPAPARIAVATPEVPAELGVLADLASLEAALGISAPPSSVSSGREAGGGGHTVSPFDRVAELREKLDADAMPLHDVLRIGLEAERVSRERDRLFPSFEEFLGDVTARDRGRGD